MKNFLVYLIFTGMFLAISIYGEEILAQSEISIFANTDKDSYVDGDKIVVSGAISDFDSETHSDIALTYRATDPGGNIVSLGQALPNFKGNFGFDFDAGGSFFSQSGNYKILIFFESVSKEILFSYDAEEPSLPFPELNDDTGNKIITVKMNGPSTFYFGSPNQIIRASVEIHNYTPSDGQYFMKVIHIPTQKTLKDFEIYPRSIGNDIWAVQIAYPILESDVIVGGQKLDGEFEIQIRTEFDSQTASTKFSILESFVEPPIQTQNESDIPGWIKNNAAWWAENKISESEFLQAIEYLIENNIMEISNSEIENLPSIIHTYSLPSSRTTEYAEISGELLEKPEGTLTLTVLKPDKSEETITTISRNGFFMTTMALTSESLVGQYQVYTEFENNLILVSAFNVKDADSNMVPEWIKNNAEWWAQDSISDDDFVKGIQYLVEEGIIIV